ncbi:MAG: putative lipid II flippase FtsW [Ruminiclostridium sp.]|nr:putative lipid II flippase FtsW [Ruminiclostridium sp.]
MQNSRDSGALRQRTENSGRGNIRAYGASDITAAVRRPQPVKQNRKAIPMHPDKQKEKKKKKVLDFSIPQKFDFSFFLIVLILLTFGLIMLFSATYASAKVSAYKDSYYFINRQLLFAGFGIAAMILISFIDYHLLFTKVVMKTAIVVAAGLMILVRVMGSTVNGAERWIALGPVTIQPSEILKFVTIMVIADYMQRNYDNMKSLTKGFIPIMIRIGIACGLVVIQPHLSATLIILVISICMLYIGGAKGTHVAGVLVLIGIAAVMVFTVFPMLGFDYVSARMLSLKDPEADIQGDTYQTYQSLIALGSGGWFGQGLGNSHQKYSYLPFAENDFIFSVIVEELGFVGAVVVVLLFLLLIIRGFYIAASAPDKEGMLLCSGIVIQIGIQAFLNIAVASNAFFNTGVSLPFFSYGGTALLMQLGEMGVVLNISRKASI